MGIGEFVLEEGSLIYLAYTARIKDSGELLDTTYEEEAKKLGHYDQTKKYEPHLVAVNKGWVLKGLDEALLKAKVGDKTTVEIPPEKGFGVRDPNKIKSISIRKFGSKADELTIGSQIQVDDKIANVVSIGSGRVQLDYNNRLAGRTIIYDIEVTKELTEINEMVKALIERRFKVEETTFEIAQETLTIDVPQSMELMDGLQYIKRATSNDIFDLIKGIKEVIYREKYLP